MEAQCTAFSLVLKKRSFQEICFIRVTFLLSKTPEFCHKNNSLATVEQQEFQINKKALCSYIGPGIHREVCKVQDRLMGLKQHGQK